MVGMVQTFRQCIACRIDSNQGAAIQPAERTSSLKKRWRVVSDVQHIQSMKLLATLSMGVIAVCAMTQCTGITSLIAPSNADVAARATAARPVSELDVLFAKKKHEMAMELLNH